MKDSRSITQYLKKANENTYVNFEILDRINPNTFEMTKNGRIQSSVFGAFSSLIIKLNVLQNNTFKNIEYAIHPDRLGLVFDKILNDRLRTFTKQNRKNPEFFGEVFKSIFTTKVVGTKYECSSFNIYYVEDKEEFVVNVKTGVGTLVKDETNRNDFKDFEKKNYIGISIPYDEMELICYQVREYLSSYRLTMTPSMLRGRYTYETKCKTIFKGCNGDAKKIKEIEEKFNQLSSIEQQECLEGKKGI